MIFLPFESDTVGRPSLALRNSLNPAKGPQQIPATLSLLNKKQIGNGVGEPRRAFSQRLQAKIFLPRKWGFWFTVVSVFYFSAHCFAESLNAVAVNASAPVAEGSAPAPQYDASKFIKPESRFMRRPTPKSPEVKLREVSDMYEKHFLREMTKAMRSTVQESGFIKSNQAEKIFREQLDEHYVEKWSERGGIGFSDLIYKQLIDKFGTQLGIKAAVEKPKGPLPVNNVGYRARPFQHKGRPTSTMAYRIDIAPEIQGGIPKPGSRDVKAPWAGAFGAVKVLEDQSLQVDIEHDNGLKSQVVFKGSLSKLSTGQKVQAGDTLGFLSSEAKSIYWTVETDQTPRPQTVSE